MLDPGSRPLFNEYLEMMIQYGFITMFVPAFPLAPLFGLLNNLFEIRGDAKKLVNQYRRPVLERVQTIGIWLTIITVLANIAIRTNACIIAFTTQFIDRCVYQHSYSPDGSMKGFVNFTLSYMSTIVLISQLMKLIADMMPIVLHRAAKFIFVFAFETIATILTNLIMAAVPDVPKHIKREMYHEANITNAIILNAEVGNQQYNKTITKDINFKKIIIRSISTNLGPTVYTFHSYELPLTCVQVTTPLTPYPLTDSSNNAPQIGFSHFHANDDSNNNNDRY
ncbi:unnamed protein product [Heterobilharzia americana]|nr:unnamed protein product [Heterobilharzia americana]